MPWTNVIQQASCFDVLNSLPDRSINVVITSPPYAEQRKKQYGGISEADYPAWTVAWMAAVWDRLTDDGSVAIVIRPHLKNGQISDYMLHTRLAIRAAGWIECEELIWTKPGSPPMGNILRPRRSWESIHWFAKSDRPFCNALANGQPSDRLGLESKKGMGDYMHDLAARETTSGIARCRDYVEVSTSEVNRDPLNTHPAQYPERLCEWLIGLLCPPSGLVFDPFMGAGTTAVAAQTLGRRYAGSEINAEYVRIANHRLAACDLADSPFLFAADHAVAEAGSAVEQPDRDNDAARHVGQDA
jgi:site-specific DNA-methyltransferase (adenine-specific)